MEGQALDLYNRQERRIANIVCPSSLDLRTPFARPEWTSFILRCPRPLREGRWLHQEMLKRFYPRLARIPTTVAGRAIVGDTRSPFRPPRRWWNYTRLVAYLVGFPAPTNPTGLLNARQYMLDRRDLQQAIGELIEDAARRPFLESRAVKRLWRDYLRRREIRWRRIERVVALEANLQAHGL
jgi:hypothetical protein